MTSPERVFALLVEANPVPDPDALADGERHLHVVETRRQTMQTQREERVQPEHLPPRKRSWIPGLAAAAALIVAFVALVLFTRGDDPERPVATQPPVTEAPPATIDAGAARAEEALTRVDAFYAALNTGDLAAIESITEAGEADARMWAFNAAFADAYPRQVEQCEVLSTANSLYVEVACTIRVTEPQFLAAGVDEVVEPWSVFDEGAVRWRPIATEGFSDAVRAMRNFLVENHPEAYDEACNPSNYVGSAINNAWGLALTGECGQLIAPIVDEMAAWIEANEIG